MFDDSDKDWVILNHLNFCFPLFLFVTPTTVISPTLTIALETDRPTHCTEARSRSYHYVGTTKHSANQGHHKLVSHQLTANIIRQGPNL